MRFFIFSKCRNNLLAVSFGKHYFRRAIFVEYGKKIAVDPLDVPLICCFGMIFGGMNNGAKIP